MWPFTYLRHRRSNKGRDTDENAMDVDNDDGIAETEDSMSVDSEGNPPEETKKPKLKPRKSQLNMEALTQEQAAVAALEADEILRLRLKKKYYAEALSFIRLIENSMELMVQLLGSTNKAEVLETMEFFRLAHRYEMEGTKV
jgi:condensin complex subunit 1